MENLINITAKVPPFIKAALKSEADKSSLTLSEYVCLKLSNESDRLGLIEKLKIENGDLKERLGLYINKMPKNVLQKSIVAKLLKNDKILAEIYTNTEPNKKAIVNKHRLAERGFDFNYFSSMSKEKGFIFPKKIIVIMEYAYKKGDDTNVLEIIKNKP